MELTSTEMSLYSSNIYTAKPNIATEIDMDDFQTIEDMDLSSLLKDVDNLLQDPVPGCEGILPHGEQVGVSGVTDFPELQVAMEEKGPLSPGNWEDFHCYFPKPSPTQSATCWSPSASSTYSVPSPHSNSSSWQNPGLTDSFMRTPPPPSQPMQPAYTQSRCVVQRIQGSNPTSQAAQVPIVKTEANATIPTPMLLPQIKVEPVEPTHCCTQYEEKRERRKAQNRRAAAKLRIKKKNEEQLLHQSYKAQEVRRKSLEEEVGKLQHKLRDLENVMRAHLNVCPTFRAQMAQISQ